MQLTFKGTLQVPGRKANLRFVRFLLEWMVAGRNVLHSVVAADYSRWLTAGMSNSHIERLSVLGICHPRKRVRDSVVESAEDRWERWAGVVSRGGQQAYWWDNFQRYLYKFTDKTCAPTSNLNCTVLARLACSDEVEAMGVSRSPLGPVPFVAAAMDKWVSALKHVDPATLWVQPFTGVPVHTPVQVFDLLPVFTTVQADGTVYKSISPKNCHGLDVYSVAHDSAEMMRLLITNIIPRIVREHKVAGTVAVLVLDWTTWMLVWKFFQTKQCCGFKSYVCPILDLWHICKIATQSCFQLLAPLLPQLLAYMFGEDEETSVSFRMIRSVPGRQWFLAHLYIALRPFSEWLSFCCDSHNNVRSLCYLSDVLLFAVPLVTNMWHHLRTGSMQNYISLLPAAGLLLYATNHTNYAFGSFAMYGMVNGLTDAQRKALYASHTCLTAEAGEMKIRTLSHAVRVNPTRVERGARAIVPLWCADHPMDWNAFFERAHRQHRFAAHAYFQSSHTQGLVLWCSRLVEMLSVGVCPTLPDIFRQYSPVRGAAPKYCLYLLDKLNKSSWGCAAKEFEVSPPEEWLNAKTVQSWEEHRETFRDGSAGFLKPLSAFVEQGITTPFKFNREYWFAKKTGLVAYLSGRLQQFPATVTRDSDSIFGEWDVGVVTTPSWDLQNKPLPFDLPQDDGASSEEGEYEFEEENTGEEDVISNTDSYDEN